MSNPIFKNQQNNRLNQFQSQFFGNGNQNNMVQMLYKFGSQFQGNPQETVQELINSGEMTQEQYEFFSNMANKFQAQVQKMMGRK